MILGIFHIFFTLEKHLSFAAAQQFCDDHKLNNIYVHDYQISYANFDLRHQYGIFGVDT